MPIKIGIIGGTGIKSMDVFSIDETKVVETRYGSPSSSLFCGKIKGVDCVLLSRHGHDHSTMPTNINFRANILALKNEGCTHIIATTACGSLKEEIKPGDFVIPNQFLDRTTKRPSTFYDGGINSFKGVCHIPMKDPFNKKLCSILAESCKLSHVSCHVEGTVITVEGPRFSTLAESNLFRSWGASVINMTSVPEVVLANELGMIYSAVALVTDYDCWKDDHGSVDVASVLKVMEKNGENACRVIVKSIELLANVDWSKVIAEMSEVANNSVMKV